jgi:hypothetical protein
MSNKTIQALKELHKELGRIGPAHPELQGLFEKTARAIEYGEPLPLADSLREAGKTFEVCHPQLTALINNVLTSLSSLGI